ncbi:MAG TPA: hypothetical protein VEA58_02745 [Anaerovoracaceae bacterium]|nr:hypothetical protein [Anaerovoracaceae bacterium]
MNYVTYARNVKSRLIYVDVDGVLCSSLVRDCNGELDYNHSVPIQQNIDIVNALYENNTIVLFTARGKRTGKIDWREFTRNQMKQWGVKHHYISFEKPHYDIMICDKAVNSFVDFFKHVAENKADS